VLVILTNLAFATLAFSDQPSLFGLGLVVSADNFAYQFAGTAFIAYMSGLTNAAYTATQYALFSSIFALPGKLLMGLSGFVVDAVGYPWFFLYTSLLGLPALLLIVYLERTTPRPPPPTAGA
jgi:MFS transporter, PAT family, beta-lactamase induction signal transducer AmpG